MGKEIGERIESLLDRQRQAWNQGCPVSVEELLSASDFPDHLEMQLDLIYNEIVLREERGEQPTEDEYTSRYPRLRAALVRQFEVHRALRERLLTETARLIGLETVPEADSPLARLEAQLPGYQLLHLLGQGGMGVVYQARHRQLNRSVALKMFRPGRVPTDRELKRFQVEAEAIARLQHANIVQIFEVGQAGELPYIALELVEGGTLAERLQRLPFEPRAAAELIRTLALAVQHAHEHHLVHRDLKPSNVLFTKGGTPKLTDFGLAKLLEDEGDSPRDATRSGDPIGTPRYMSPEQAAGQHDLIGPKTDVYGLGTLLYETLTSQVPFVSTSVLETLQRIRTEDPQSPRRMQPAIPCDLETICLHCLHKEPSRRYSSAAALADDLNRFLSGEPIHARAVPWWERVWKWRRRRPGLAALLAVSLVLFASGIVAAGYWNHREKQRIAGLKLDVEERLRLGHDALANHDLEAAQERFREAWRIVQGEPALAPYETGVAGWLDHSLRAANRQSWKQRQPPREFDERRDEAIVLSALLDSPDADGGIAAARQAIAEALEFTVPDDSAWQRERELLAILDAALIERGGDVQAALLRMEAAGAGVSQAFLARKAAYLERLHRGMAAEMERRRAARLPPDERNDRFLLGVEKLRCREFAGAGEEFEGVLELAPEHFLARYFAALCAYYQGRFGEARVGLTACIAQRPRFPGSYAYRGECRARGGDAAGASRDFARAVVLKRHSPLSDSRSKR